MTQQDDAAISPEEQLNRDKRVEARLIWKGLISLALVVVLAIARQKWWM